MNKLTTKWIDDHKEELISVLQKTITFNSVRDDATAGPGAPFGKGPAACLEYVLQTSENLGFDVKNMDGYVGCVDWGKGEEQLAILSHLDVVPEGNGWKYPPYGGEIHDGCIWGRGTMDDKGPGIAALFALAAVKNCGFEARRRVRIIFGCDEECGMGCLEHYSQIEKAPDMAFSPDAEYPLINSEKMIYGASYKRSYPSSIQVCGGTVSNAVTGDCEAWVPVAEADVKKALDGIKKDPAFTYTVKAEGKGTSIAVVGVAAHASTPDQGKNAFYAVVELLAELNLPAEDLKTIKGLKEVLCWHNHGEAFGIDSEDTSGRLTMNCGVIKWDESGIERLSVDIRAPISSNADHLTECLRKGFAKAGCEEVGHEYSDGYCVPEDSEIVSTLMGVYNEVTGTQSKPMAIGGGTYARHLKNAVAFGPERPGELATIHMANEFIRIDHLIEDAKIYAESIIRLACK